MGCYEDDDLMIIGDIEIGIIIFNCLFIVVVLVVFNVEICCWEIIVIGVIIMDQIRCRFGGWLSDFIELCFGQPYPIFDYKFLE